MADASSLPPWLQGFGDTVGLPGLVASGYAGAKALGGLGRYGANAIRGIAGAPVAAPMAALYAMGDGTGNATTALNVGEQDLYVRGPDGQMVPNTGNPMVRNMLEGQWAQKPPMSPMPASDPWPGTANGMNPPNPAMFAGFPNSAPVASSSPSPSQAALPSPSPAPQAGLGGGVPLPQPRPFAAGSTGEPMDLAAPGQPPNSSLYGADAGGFGPGGPSTAPRYSALGFMTGAPSNGQFNMGNFLKGGNDAQAALKAAPDKPFWNIARLLNNSFGSSGFGGGSDSAIS